MACKTLSGVSTCCSTSSWATVKLLPHPSRSASGGARIHVLNFKLSSSSKHAFHESQPMGRRRASPRASLAEAIDPLPELEKVIVSVKNFKLAFGQQLGVVGGASALGAWNAADAVPLTWVTGDSWTKYISLPHGQHEAKVLILNAGGEPQWADGPNITITIPLADGESNAPFSFGPVSGTLCFSGLERLTGRKPKEPQEGKADTAAPSGEGVAPSASARGSAASSVDRSEAGKPLYVDASGGSAPSTPANGVSRKPGNGASGVGVDVWMKSTLAEAGEDGTLLFTFSEEAAVSAAALVQELLEAQRKQQQK